MKFRCAVIGLGRIGAGFDDKSKKQSINTHTKAYFINKKTNLIALCDVDKNKLEKYGKIYNVQNLHSDYNQLFKNEDLDCISICTLSDSHLELVEEAVRHNIKGIFLEKPISDSLESAMKIIKKCEEKGIKLQIDYQRRFDPLYQNIKENIIKEKFGKIQHVNFYYGAGIANTGSHLFDLIRFFFGDVRRVQGVYSSNTSNNLTDPNINGHVECKNDIICSLNSLDVSKYGIMECDILGTKGRIRINLAKSTPEYFSISNEPTLAYRNLTEVKYKIPKRKPSIVLGLENLISSIEKNKKTLCTGIDGYGSLEIVIALKKSAEKNGTSINLPLKRNTYKVASK